MYNSQPATAPLAPWTEGSLVEGTVRRTSWAEANARGTWLVDREGASPSLGGCPTKKNLEGASTPRQAPVVPKGASSG